MYVRLLAVLCLVTLVTARSVMLIGGGLRDDNDEIYGKFVELAVNLHSFTHHSPSE